MSADNWAICPRCKYEAEEVSLEEANKPIELDSTFREDYEIGVDDTGGFSVHYSGSCSSCKLLHKFKHEQQLEAGDTGGETMSESFPWNPEHRFGTCADCGEEMIYNAPGPDGGFVHKNTARYQCPEQKVMTPEPVAATTETRTKKLFTWYCGDCRAGGTAEIELPIQVRNLCHELEESHKTVHRYHCCPSDYFEVTAISASGNAPGSGSDEVAASEAAATIMECLRHALRHFPGDFADSEKSLKTIILAAIKKAKGL